MGDPREPVGAETHRLPDFYKNQGSELFDKCRRFSGLVDDFRRRMLFECQYRVVLDGPLDAHIRARNPFTGRIEEMICFDSNSYLGLHLHPRVVECSKKALDRYGYGTPSAQVLGGTNVALRDLEDELADLYGRERTLIFSSGYSANVGTLTALLREEDLVARDVFSHASIHDGVRWSGARYGGRYRNLDVEDLDAVISRDARDAAGKLVVSDGVFSMHGRIAPVPRLRAVADKWGARLMIDDAHGLGVLGATGKGVEEHWGVEGAADILMGTFSKSPGSVGGYVCGDTDLIEYLRFFARSSMFTASLPAAICAGVTEALRIMRSEKEHRERLWANTFRLQGALADAGLVVNGPESPILTVFCGNERLLWAVSRDLFIAGFKCGNVSYPAVPEGESVIRISVNARHVAGDIDSLAETLAALGRKYGFLGMTTEEIKAVGRALPAEAIEAIEAPALVDGR